MDMQTLYRRIYSRMVGAAEDAISAIEAANYGTAKEVLIDAMQACEELYISDENTK